MLLASALSLYGTAWWGRRHPELLHDDQPGVREWLDEPASPVTPAIVAVALVVSLFAPAVGTWPLIALVLTDRLDALWSRLRRPAAAEVRTAARTGSRSRAGW